MLKLFLREDFLLLAPPINKLPLVSRLEAALLELLQAEPDKWEEVWGWAGDREYKFQTILNNWQRFRREQMAMLNWLEQKEKELESIGDVDLTNEFNVDKDLAKLKVNFFRFS